MPAVAATLIYRWIVRVEDSKAIVAGTTDKDDLGLDTLRWSEGIVGVTKSQEGRPKRRFVKDEHGEIFQLMAEPSKLRLNAFETNIRFVSKFNGGFPPDWEHIVAVEWARILAGGSRIDEYVVPPRLRRALAPVAPAADAVEAEDENQADADPIVDPLLGHLPFDDHLLDDHLVVHPFNDPLAPAAAVDEADGRDQDGFLEDVGGEMDGFDGAREEDAERQVDLIIPVQLAIGWRHVEDPAEEVEEMEEIRGYQENGRDGEHGANGEEMEEGEIQDDIEVPLRAADQEAILEDGELEETIDVRGQEELEEGELEDFGDEIIIVHHHRGDLPADRADPAIRPAVQVDEPVIEDGRRGGRIRLLAPNHWLTARGRDGKLCRVHSLYKDKKTVLIHGLPFTLSAEEALQFLRPLVPLNVYVGFSGTTVTGSMMATFIDSATATEARKRGRLYKGRYVTLFTKENWPRSEKARFFFPVHPQ